MPGAVSAGAEKTEEGKEGNRRRRLLLVCTGNICRSPMAEHVLRRHLGERAEWEVESAGVYAMDGAPASPQAIEALREKGIDLSRHRSRGINGGMVRSADLIVAMTENQAEEIRRRFPDARERVFTLAAFDPGRRGGDVPDPVGSSTEVYRKIRDEMEESLLDLMLYLKSGARRSSASPNSAR